MKKIDVALKAQKLHAYNNPFDYNKTLSVLNYTTNSVAAGVITNLGKIPAALGAFIYEASRNSLRMLSNVALYRRNKVIEKRNERTPLRRLSRVASKAKTVVANHKRIAIGIPLALALVAGYFKGPQAWEAIRSFEYKTTLRAGWHKGIDLVSGGNNKVFGFAKDCLSKMDGLVAKTIREIPAAIEIPAAPKTFSEFLVDKTSSLFNKSLEIVHSIFQIN